MTLNIPTRLRNAIEDDPGKLILWVGAGLSRQGVRQLGRGLVGWEGLMKRMIQHLEDNLAPAPATARARRALALARYLTVASIFARNTTEAEFSDFIRAELDPDDLIPSAVHELILRVGFRGIFTTNFDRVFERQTTGVDVILRYPECLDDPTAFRRPGFVAKIHGCVTQAVPAKLVVTRASYRALSRDQKYRTILQSYFCVYPVLTVGYSFRDPDFKAAISAFRIFKVRPPIFALMLRPDAKAVTALKRQGIDVIAYNQPHELRSLFAALLNMAEKKKPSPTVTLRKPPLRSQCLKHVKPGAWDYYARWRSDVGLGLSLSPVLGPVRVTLRGWRHIKRVRVPPGVICHRLALLPCAREIIETAITYRVVRRLGKRCLLSLEGVYRSPFEADVIVEVIVERRRLTGDRTTTTLLSVHEKRYSTYWWSRGRDLSS